MKMKWMWGASDFTVLYEIKDRQNDTVNKDRQHEKYRYN